MLDVINLVSKRIFIQSERGIDTRYKKQKIELSLFFLFFAVSVVRILEVTESTVIVIKISFWHVLTY